MTAARDAVFSCDPTPVDRTALTDALQLVAARCGRLSDDEVRAMRRRRRRTAVTTTATGTAVAVLAFVGANLLPLRPNAPAHATRLFATHPGQRGVATLADGSSIHLNGATRVWIDFTDARRTARLLSGQAYFDVRHDIARPFTVQAGAAQVRVLGTAFDLDLTRRQVALAVYRGAVGFGPDGAKPGVVVRAGFHSSFAGGTAATPTRFDPSLPDWRQGWMDTAGMRLDNLVEMLNRQGSVKIEAPGEPLASTIISGRFRTDQPRALLGAIGNGFGFTVVERQDGLRLQPARRSTRKKGCPDLPVRAVFR